MPNKLLPNPVAEAGRARLVGSYELRGDGGREMP